MITKERLIEITTGTPCKNKDELIASIKYFIETDGYDKEGNLDLEFHHSEWNLILDALKAY